MKNNGVIIFIVGALVIATVYSIMQLQKVQKTIKSNNRMIEGEPVTDTEPTPPAKVSAEKFTNALKDEMNSNKDINITINN